MIKLISLHIENFRGIRNLPITLGNESLAIKGPNGSGKSGIVDAVEFALTGNITRLTGIGTGNVSIKSHAPHVDFKDTPENAKVTLVLSLPSGDHFTLERTVASPLKPKISPDTLETRSAINFTSSHPEFSLSRREILKFVLTEAGKRAKEVQALLKLESIDKNRAAFQATSNTMSRQKKDAEAALQKARADLLGHLKISELTSNTLIIAINERRKILGLEVFNELTADIKVSDGIVSEPNDPKKLIPKVDATSKVNKLIEFFDGIATNETPQIIEGIEAITTVKQQPNLLSSLARQSLYETGVDLILDDSCPLCDREWGQPELLQHVKDKINKNKEAGKIKNAIVTAVNERLRALRSFVTDLNQLSQYAITLGLNPHSKIILTTYEKFQELEQLTNNPLEKLSLIETTLISPQSIPDQNIITSLKILKTELEKLPDHSATEAAKQYLIISDERLAHYRRIKADHKLKSEQATIASSLLKHFEQSSESMLITLYDDVEKEFSRYYRKLNNDDENNFTARLEHQDGTLNFEVDFYGRGKFPPNAYHSEGHQDSMGLCLYFALSKKLLGTSFSLCLLDDVLMSVDSGHRREVCKLLRTEFPSTQFILTTHDEVWSKQLVLEGLIKGKNLLQFRKWTVEDGPAAWDFAEIWGEIETDIESNDIPSAAQGLRRYLEFLMSELAFKLRANMEARPIANYDLGELLPAATARFKDLLSKAKEAANSWNKKDEVTQIAALDSSFGKKYSATNAEQWAVNASIHYNEWANLSREDFNAVLNRFRELIDAFKCSACNGWYYVSPSKGRPEMLRCDCGELTLNLRKK